jgi:SAM-dependent methyltransferase
MHGKWPWRAGDASYAPAMELSRRELLLAAALPSLAGLTAPELEVPFVPTPHSLVQKMLDLAAVGASDYLIDLGCGDGRIAVAAALRGARALGVDLDRLRIAEAHAAARLAGVEARASFRRQDLFATPIYEASVIALYLLPEINLRLRPRLLTELRPGARIVSHAFTLGDWRPEAEEVHDGRRIFLWIVPAVAGGRWQLREESGPPLLLEIEQRFQQVGGTLGAFPLINARLRGTALTFTAGERTYRGTVDGAAIIGDGWSARRLD